MAVLDPELDELVQRMDDRQIRGLFTGLDPGFFPSIGTRTLVAGEVVSFGDDWIDLRARWFTPAAGFVIADHPSVITVSLDDALNRCLHLCQGIDIICAGERTDIAKNKVRLANAQICFRPELAVSMPWDVTHLFCGAFCGWHHLDNPAVYIVSLFDSFQPQA